MSILSAVKNYASNVAGGAKIVSSAIKGAVAPKPVAKPMVFPVGQGLNSGQTANAYSAISKAAQPATKLAGTTGSNIAPAKAALARAVSNPVGTAKTVASTVGRAVGGIARGVGGAIDSGNTGSSLAAPIAPVNSFLDSYKGKTGVSTVTSPASYTPRGGTSLEGRAMEKADQEVGTQVGGERTDRVEFLDSSQKNREAQIAALSAQLNNTVEARDAALAAEATGDSLETDLDADGKIDTVEGMYANEEKASLKWEKQLEALQREIEKAGQMTPEEEEAKRMEDALTAEEAKINAQVGEETTAVAGQPIPQGFISGQQKGIYEKGNSALTRIAAQKVPLQQKLANIMAKRKMAEESARDSYKYTADAYDRSGERSKERRTYSAALSAEDRQRNQKIADEYNQSFNLGEGQARYAVNPQTGKIELVASRAQTYAPQKETTPTSYREWELAGKPGSYADWVGREI